MREYRCETRTTPRTRSPDDIWVICRYRVRVYELGGRFTIIVEILGCWIDDSGEGGEEEPSLTLDCPATPLRGSTANCVASLEGGAEDTVAVVFEWKSDHANRTDSSGTGESTWGGVATDTIDITVTVITGEENEDTLSDTKTVSVRARTWTLSGVAATPQHVDSLPARVGNWGSGRWGLHVWQATGPDAVEGSGPWENEYMTDAKPSFLNAIYLHSDLVAGGAVYPGAYAAADSLCGRPQPPIPDSASVYTVNDKCGSGGSLAMWADSVRAHEEKHETSLNACITSATAATAMIAIEALVGTEAAVKKGLTTHWRGDSNTDLFTKLEQAAETPYNEPNSPLIWEYRYLGAWSKHSLILGGHSGRVGC